MRAWEARHGFPEPHRLPNGHRRYRASEIERIEHVVRARAAGLSLDAAVAQARQRTRAADRSIFSGLRNRRPDLTPHVISEPTMLAISRAIEDECCAVASRPRLVACFQRDRFYQRSRARWQELARTARIAVVLADFGRHEMDGDVVKVALPRPEPLRREWAVICQAPDGSAVLAGWEIPGSRRAAPRRFEAVWSAEPAVVAIAARIALGLGRELAAELLADDRTGGELGSGDEDPARTVRRATALTNRVVAYLDAARPPST